MAVEAADAHFFAALAGRVGVPADGLDLSGWHHVTDESIVFEFYERHGRVATRHDVDAVKAVYEAALRTPHA